MSTKKTKAPAKKASSAPASKFSLLRFIQKMLFWCVILFFTSSLLVTLIYKWCPVYVTPLMIIRCIEQKFDGKEVIIRHEWVPLDEMSEYMPVAVIASEDQNFLKHNGFDLKAIGEALQEKADGKRVRGGSTISQQTAKNVFLWPNQSWIRKGFEAYFTFLIEKIWGKRRIMEVYLNSIEMGDGTYGAEAVARTNFGKSAGSLTRNECALIAATLPNPLKFDSANPSKYMRQRQRAIGVQMKHIDLFPKE